MDMHKLGINYFQGFGITCEEWIKTVRGFGFDAAFTDHTVKSLGESIGMGAFAELAAKHGLEYDCVHAPFDGINAIWSENTDEGNAMLKRLTDCVEDCGKYGVPKVVVHLSSGIKAPYINDAGHARFDRLVDCAVKNNVTIAFENQRKLANLAFVMETYSDVENVGFCWDVGHEKCFADGMEFMPLFGKRLVYTHIHDNYATPNGDLHLIPFDGRIDFVRTAELLKKYLKNETITLEVFPIKGKDGYEKYEKLTAKEYYAKAYSAAVKIREMVNG